MHDHERRAAGGAEHRDAVLQEGGSRLRVEPREGLVEQQHVRSDRECAGQVHAPALAAGQPDRRTRCEPVDAEQAQRLERPRAPL